MAVGQFVRVVHGPLKPDALNGPGPAGVLAGGGFDPAASVPHSSHSSEDGGM